MYMPPLMITFFILHSLDRRRRPIWTGCWLIFSGMRHFILSWHVTIYLPPSLLLEAKRKPQYEMPHSFICIYDFSYLFSRSQFWWLKLRERRYKLCKVHSSCVCPWYLISQLGVLDYKDLRVVNHIVHKSKNVMCKIKGKSWNTDCLQTSTYFRFEKLSRVSTFGSYLIPKWCIR